jgi:hypothetical protein
MATILLSIIFSLLIPIFHVVLIAIFRKEGLHIKLMFVAFLFYILLDIYFKFILYHHSQEFSLRLISSFSTSVFMCLFYLEAFSMIARGFSMRIVTDIYLNSSLNSEGVLQEYAAGKGIAWMFQKRLEGIEKLGFISIEGDLIKIASKNAIYIAQISLFYKSLLKLGRGG